MAITYTASTYGTANNLWQMVQDYTQNTEPSFVFNIPTFVQVAEERVYNTVQIPALRKSVTGSVTTGNQYLGLPTDYLAPFAMSVIDPATAAQSFMLNKDVEFIRQSFPTPTSIGQPTHYAQFDTVSFILGPTPDQTYTVELHYYYYPPSITTATTSWLGTNASNVLLYGTLREAYLYMKGEQDMIAYYEKKYEEGIQMLKDLAEGKGRRDTYRSGQIRVVPT
ncbi:MAG: hypothetical protein WCO62_00370 [Betaproteobacteria bacterium]